MSRAQIHNFISIIFVQLSTELNYQNPLDIYRRVIKLFKVFLRIGQIKPRFSKNAYKKAT